LKGALVAHYRVQDQIGVGGMGIVYKAEDIKLGRPVALKVLPERLALDSVAVERFRREARAASSLNHPNICTIYEIEQRDGREFIAMEFLDGMSLATYLAGRAHSGDTVAKLGIPVAEALAAAHSKGVIHRDVKPGNIFVTSSGLVKVLDFGVAKLLHRTDNATIDSLTETNAITGTLPYMSPEQLRGEDLDARSDIFALGIVLYEMATGHRPYTSSLHGKLIDEILHQSAPPPSNSNRNLSPKLDEVILKCLEKDPELRYQTAKEIAVDLRRISAPAMAQLNIPGRRLNVRRWVTRAALTILIAAAAIWYFLPKPLPRVTGSSRITDFGSALVGSIVTDGSGIYFNTWNGIRQVSLNGGETAEFRSLTSDATVLDISPDRSQLLTMSGGTSAGENMLLWAMPLPTGSPRRLANVKADAMGATWSRDMKRLAFIHGSELWLAKSDGTDAMKVVSVDGHPFAPTFSPDTRRIRFSVLDTKHATNSIWDVRVDGSDLHQVFRDWNNPPHECCGIWTPDGRYYVFRSTSRNDWTEIVFGSGDIYAAPEASALFRRSASTPIRLTFGPLLYAIGGFTPDGKKLLLTANEPHSELVRYDPTSKKLMPFLGGMSAKSVSFSPDGKSIAYVKTLDDTLWTRKTDGNDRFQLTYPPDHIALPRWSPDGTQIAFLHWQPGKPSKTAVISSKGGTATDLTQQQTSESDPNWSPDGTRIVFAAGLDSQSDIRIIDLRTREVSLVRGSTGKLSPRWSPDGRYLAALESSPISKKLYLFDFRTGKWSDWLADSEGTAYPTWTSDSRYVVYGASGDLKRVKVGDKHPELLLSLKGLVEGWTDVAPDGSWMFVRDASTQDIYSLDVDFP
jgi:Tol biopolymer transport system component